ncbi:MAG: Co2+/Mg2+ efflux protein ApaG [Candidatus Sedimenticola endophacoides]
MQQQARRTFDIRVTTAFVEQQSIPEEDHYVFSYTITIKNTGEVAARLISRHWLITDANGKTQEVHGEGVVGEQPYLQPGDNFSYTSGTALATPIGSMRGSYQMRTERGEFFDAPIPVFPLAKPNTLN